ncbi:hypothetical protein ABID97_002341 [Variovorax sp. OAS795]|uniref:hypothetical protein n=1 Tax=Variovorax sp. OAS795 TaxID=3034231 RepID=UPI0033909FFA
MPLFLLLRLQRVQLPVRVTDPDEVRQVSVLVATGLVDADFATIKSRVRHAVMRVATVTRITEDGLAEIASTGKTPAPPQAFIRFAGGLRLL